MKKPCRSEGVNQEYLGRARFLGRVKAWTKKENRNSSNDHLDVLCKYDSLFDLVSALSVTSTKQGLPSRVYPLVGKRVGLKPSSRWETR